MWEKNEAGKSIGASFFWLEFVVTDTARGKKVIISLTQV